MKKTSENKPLLGFETELIVLPLDCLLPRRLAKNYKQSHTYQTILKSIKESGVIEPLVVYPHDSEGNYILLDGHWRYHALQELKQKSVACLVSISDESFTYNHYVNRLSVIQAQRMILKAIKRGVPKRILAKALNIDIKSLILKQSLLKGINPDVVEMLKDKNISETSLRELKQVDDSRQIEIAELMVGMNNYTVSYLRALISATPKDQMVRKTKKHSDEVTVKMEIEMRHLEKEFQQIEENYGSNVYNLTLSISYIKRLLSNGKIVTYLSKKHHDMFLEFEELIQQESL